MTMWVAILAVLAATVVQAISLDDMGKHLGRLCKTFYFILPNTVNQSVNVVFLVIGIKISRSIHEYNSG